MYAAMPPMSRAENASACVPASWRQAHRIGLRRHVPSPFSWSGTMFGGFFIFSGSFRR